MRPLALAIFSLFFVLKSFSQINPPSPQLRVSWAKIHMTNGDIVSGLLFDALDTGIVYLPGIRNKDDLSKHPFKPKIIDTRDIFKMTVIQRGKLARSFAAGLGIGALFGVGAGPYIFFGGRGRTTATSYGVYALGFGLLGAIPGALIGAIPTYLYVDGKEKFSYKQLRKLKRNTLVYAYAKLKRAP